MKTKLVLLFSVTFIFNSGNAQVPQGFNYQAVARDGSGNLIVNQTIPVRITIQASEAGGTIFWQELHSSVSTNVFGLINLVIGTGTRQTVSTVANFSDIDWSVSPKYIKTEIDRGGWTAMGAAKLWSVPYSLVAEEASGLTSGKKLSVTSSDDATTDALFEVKRQDGQTVFAVYPDAVNVFVPQSSAKGSKGGFAVGGFGDTKETSQDYLRVTPDSVRIYIDSSPTFKGSKGGFAVGGYGNEKGINDMYFNLTGASAVDTVKSSPQVLWYPNKNAFLAGDVHIGAVDSVGNYSTALGYQSIAMGDYSQAFGYKAKALGNYSTSIGRNSVAGSKSAPLANYAFAFGNGARAIGDDSYALGSGSTASGYRSFAYGFNSTASNTNSLALGNGTAASGTNAVAMGYQSQSKGDKSIAIGSYYTYSYVVPIISLGKGEETGSKGLDDFLLIRPITTATTITRSFSRANIAEGQYSVAVGNGNLAQNGGLVFGSNSDAVKSGALALGTSAAANESNSVAMGYNSAANGIYSLALGNNVTANSYGEISLGQWNESISGTYNTWNDNELLFTIGNGVNDANRSNALTIYKNGKTIVRGRYAVTTFNYSKTRLVIPGFVFKDYVYGIYSNLNRDNTAIEYYYSGWFGATGTAGIYYGLYADTRSGGSIDVAEYIYDTANNTEPADVVVADVLNKESVVKSTKPYQSSVVGVISTKPHMTMGMELVVDEKTGEPLKDAKPATRLALTGRVPVKVTGENGPIVPGDILTTSSTPGHAMKWSLLDVSKAKDFEEMKTMVAENDKRRSAVIGKAVESFSGNGTGKVIVIVDLH